METSDPAQFVSRAPVRGTGAAVRGVMMCGLLAVGALAGCGFAEASTATLPPLPPSSVPPPVEASARTPRRTPQSAWYGTHRRVVDEELAAIRALRDELSATVDAYVVAMICRKGANLDDPRFVATTSDPDAHPVWVELVDLTTWMVAACAQDAGAAVADLLPRIDERIDRFDTWRTRIAGGVGSES